MLKTCRKYLNWNQNSVFEGEITDANYERLISELKKIMKEKEGDSLVIYKLRTTRYSERIVIGVDKKGETQFL
jgi:CRISPR-associated protein Cas2